MANLQLKEEVESLRKLREQYEEQLRLVGLELSDLPDDVSAMLDECVELQRATQLHDLSEELLKEFYYIHKKEHIVNTLTVAKMQNEIKEQERQLEKERSECALLEKFITNVNKRLLSEAEMDRNKIMLEAKIQEILTKQDTLNVAENLNIDDLIEKVERLEKSKLKK